MNVHGEIARFQHFLTFVLDSPARIQNLWGKTTQAAMDLSGGEIYHPPVRLLWFSAFHDPGEQDYREYRMLLTYPEIASRFDEVFGRWHQLWSLIGPVLNLYFATRYSSSLFIEHRFLSLTQVLEGFHRHSYGGKYQSDEEYQANVAPALVAAIPAEVAQAHRAALRSRIRFGNEYSLRKRLSELLRDLPETPRRLFRDPDAFVGEVVDARNYLTHYPETQDSNQVDADLVASMADRLDLVCKLFLLRRIGINDDEISDITERRWFEWRWLADE